MYPLLSKKACPVVADRCHINHFSRQLSVVSCLLYFDVEYVLRTKPHKNEAKSVAGKIRLLLHV